MRQFMAICMGLGLFLTGWSLSRADEPDQVNLDVGVWSPQVWIPELKSSDPQARAMAALALGRMGPTARMAVPYLIADLRDQDAKVREMAAWALGQIGSEFARPAVPALAPLLRDPDPRVRLAAAQALRKIDPVAADNLGIH
jgi:hypothetical protein